jgi:hypothetical protein
MAFWLPRIAIFMRKSRPYQFRFFAITRFGNKMPKRMLTGHTHRAVETSVGPTVADLNQMTIFQRTPAYTDITKVREIAYGGTAELGGYISP